MLKEVPDQPRTNNCGRSVTVDDNNIVKQARYTLALLQLKSRRRYLQAGTHLFEIPSLLGTLLIIYIILSYMHKLATRLINTQNSIFLANIWSTAAGSLNPRVQREMYINQRYQ